MQSPKPILYYFDLHGRGESIRLLFAHAKVDYEDKRIQFNDWPALKAENKFEFGQIPALKVGDKYLSQQLAILRYLGKKHGYYPTDVDEAYLVDSILDAGMDFYNPYVPYFFAQGDEAKKAEREKFYKNVPGFLKVFEARIKSNPKSQEFMVGDKWTIADFLFLALDLAILSQAQHSEFMNAELGKVPTFKSYLLKRRADMKTYFDSIEQKAV